MKKLEDLKQELLDNKLNKFYVFYGEDYGIRKHYINKISSYFKSKPKYTDDYKTIELSGRTKSLFGDTASLVVIYEDEEFAKQTEKDIQEFIEGLRDYTCIFVYETALENSNLFKHFEQYITYFPIVQSNVAKEFVDSEILLSNSSATKLAYDCLNNYNQILLESNKVKEYANAKTLSDQNAYEALYLKGQLTERIDDFDVNNFMNDILTYNTSRFSYWYKVATNSIDKFFGSLVPIYNDFLIAGLIKKYGVFQGSSTAYQCKLSWGRAKTIREFDMPYDSGFLFDCAYNVAYMDTIVKNGKLAREKIVDYFFSTII